MDASEANECWLKRLGERYTTSESRYALRCLLEDMLGKRGVASEHDRQTIDKAVAEVLTGKPLQYVTGVAWFYKLKFFVDSSVLIPRPETEELVEWVLEWFDEKPLHVLDIGTGSGCIAITLKRMRPSWTVDACDVSESALEVARHNAKRLESDVTFFSFDISQIFQQATDYDLIVSNPPYISEDEATELPRDVLNFEPHQALFAPAGNPQFFYNAIAEFSRKYLNTNGSVFVELNQNTAEGTFDCFVRYFRYVEMRRDVSGHYRMLYANGLK